MNKRTALKLLLFGLLSFSVNSLQSQKKYWVKFKDKNGTPFTVNNPQAFLSQKSVSRRSVFNISINQSDLPVTPAYITQVDNVPNVTVLYACKWLNGVVISTNNLASLTTIKTFSFVLDTVKVNRYKLDFGKTPEMKPLAQQTEENTLSATSATYNYGGSYWQNHQVGVDCLHQLGVRGSGMAIAVMDVGFSNVDVNPVFDSLRARGGILGTWDFVSAEHNVYDNGAHGAEVLSCMAAIKPGFIMGSAPRADFWLFRTEDEFSETPTEEYNWIRAAELADSVGADILTTSLGYTTFDNSAQNHSYASLNGRTAPMSIAANMAARKGMFVVNAAGNEGGGVWQYISVPADADSICTVGAIDSLAIVAGFSSTGPTFDGRIKPDLVARGVGTWISSPSAQFFPGNGTSFAAPVLAGAVACYWQAHRSFSNIKMLDTLRKTASNAGNPNNSMGWGIPNMCAIPVGLKTISADVSNHVSLFPNPFKNTLHMECDNTSIQINRITVMDITGAIIYSEYTEDPIHKKSLDLCRLNKGFYFIQISTSSGTLTKKVVKSE